jgi:hypothetical protein
MEGINCTKIVNYIVDTIETDTYDTIWAEILLPIPVECYAF